MEVNKKIVTAITAALHVYLEAQRQLVASAEAPRLPQIPVPSCSPWSLAGRQTAMDMRRLWQLRLVR